MTVPVFWALQSISEVMLGGHDTGARLQQWLGAEFAGLPIHLAPAEPPRFLEVKVSTSGAPIIISDETFKECT